MLFYMKKNISKKLFYITISISILLFSLFYLLEYKKTNKLLESNFEKLNFYNISDFKEKILKRKDLEKDREDTQDFDLIEEQLGQEKMITIKVPQYVPPDRYDPENPFGIVLVEKTIPYTSEVLDAVYNVFFEGASRVGIFYENVSLDKNTASLYLTGEWSPAGIGSHPMFRDIINKAAFQFDSIDTLVVYLNGKKWDWCIDSEKDDDMCEPRYWIDSKDNSFY